MTIPRFLICDTHEQPERVFVLHTQFPKFLAEATEHEDGSVDLIPVMQFDTIPANAASAAKLMREMGDWYVSELNSLD